MNSYLNLIQKGNTKTIQREKANGNFSTRSMKTLATTPNKRATSFIIEELDPAA